MKQASTYPEHQPAALEIHEDQSQGWWIPLPVHALYEVWDQQKQERTGSRILNAEEVMLLSKLNALQSAKHGGCYASNHWLARWWDKSENWVSQTLSKFKDLELIQITHTPSGRRIIQTVFSGGEGVLEKSKTPLRKVKDPFEKSQSRTDIKSRHKESTRSRAAGAAPGDRAGFALVGEDGTTRDAKAFAHAFAKWSVQNKLHLGAQGSTKTGWKPTTITAWTRHAKELIELFGLEEVQKVWRWYTQHHGEAFVAECQTLGGFRTKFQKIRSQMKRQSNGHSRNGEHTGDDEEGQLVEEVNADGTITRSVVRR
jgi:hypothetical protein